MTTNNKKQKKILCDNLKSLVNLTPTQIDSFITVVVKCMVHDLMMDIMDSDKGFSVPLEFELPDIGKLIIEFNNNNIDNISFVIEKDFENMLKNAIFDYQSPLIEALSSAMSEKISTKYKSVI